MGRIYVGLIFRVLIGFHVWGMYIREGLIYRGCINGILWYNPVEKKIKRKKDTYLENLEAPIILNCCFLLTEHDKNLISMKHVHGIGPNWYHIGNETCYIPNVSNFSAVKILTRLKVSPLVCKYVCILQNRT